MRRIIYKIHYENQNELQRLAGVSLGTLQKYLKSWITIYCNCENRHETGFGMEYNEAFYYNIFDLPRLCLFPLRERSWTPNEIDENTNDLPTPEQSDWEFYKISACKSCQKDPFGVEEAKQVRGLYTLGGLEVVHTWFATPAEDRIFVKRVDSI